MEDEPIIVSSALRHGVTESDILHAYAQYLAVIEQGDITILVGPACNGVTLLEVGVSLWHGQAAVVHAMVARRHYLHLGGLA